VQKRIFKGLPDNYFYVNFLCRVKFHDRTTAKMILPYIFRQIFYMPYFLDPESAGYTHIKGYTFKFLGDYEFIDLKKKGGLTAFISVKFSSAVSWQLLQRHAVIRAREMLHLRSELASLLWLYLEPNLRANNEACIDLKNLIDVLQLPKAKWHSYKNKRKQQFEKAITELNGQRLADGRKMSISIRKGLQDWQLSAELKGVAIKQLEQ